MESWDNRCYTTTLAVGEVFDRRGLVPGLRPNSTGDLVGDLSGDVRKDLGEVELASFIEGSVRGFSSVSIVFSVSSVEWISTVFMMPAGSNAGSKGDGVRASLMSMPGATEMSLPIWPEVSNSGDTGITFTVMMLL